MCVQLEKEGFFGLAFVVVGEEKHTGTQDPARGASRARLAAGVREWLFDWGCTSIPSLLSLTYLWI